MLKSFYELFSLSPKFFYVKDFVCMTQINKIFEPHVSITGGKSLQIFFFFLIPR